MSTTLTVSFAIAIDASPTVEDLETFVSAARHAGAAGNFECETDGNTLTLTFEVGS